MNKMAEGINQFYADPENSNRILDESTLISIGYECDVLVE